MRPRVAILSAAVSMASVCCSLLVDTTGLAGDAPEAGASDSGTTDALTDGAVLDADADADARKLPDGAVVWPENGHGYLVVVRPSTTWSRARDLAAEMGGHLATVTSPAENAFVYQLSNSTFGAWTDKNFGPWLGGYQPTKAGEPDGGWTWVTGEAFVFSAWASGQPDDSQGREEWLHYWALGTAAPTWNDNPEDDGYVGSFVVEFE